VLSFLSTLPACKHLAKAFGFCVMLLPIMNLEAKAQTLAALPSVSQAIEKAGDARPIIGWSDFCRREPAECALNTSEPEKITLTPQVWKLIVSINRKVNRSVQASTDMDHWGIVDQWDLPTDGKGDCEDFQLLKRKLLAESGLSRRAMRMTVVIDELREGHAVLMVRTDRGDFILDNKTNSVLPWHQTGYIYVKREGHDTQNWVSLGGVTSPVTTANR
jgi:predicted transglutaminase-like cysteine proteinase